jgi:hypothetical protein
MILHLCKETLDRLWDKITPGLFRALDKTTLGEFWDLPSLRVALSLGTVYGFYQASSGYSGIYCISESPKAKQLTFFWSGKDPENETPIDYEAVDKHLEIVAKVFGCSYISCEGRVGWKKTLEPLGYSPDGSLYLKRV